MLHHYNLCAFQPALSIGNVGQLVADLLISSMGSERVGYLDDPNVLPCVGNDAYGPFPQGDLALPLEGPPLFCFHLYLLSQVYLLLLISFSMLLLINFLQLMIPLLMLSLSSNRDRR